MKKTIFKVKHNKKTNRKVKQVAKTLGMTAATGFVSGVFSVVGSAFASKVYYAVSTAAKRDELEETPVTETSEPVMA